MFLQQFENHQNSAPAIKPIRKQYSAGFRNYHPQKHGLFQQTNSSQQSQDVFDLLNVGNLKRLYMQSLPQVDTRKQEAELQRKSVERMTAPKAVKVEQQPTQEKAQSQTKMQKVQKFNEAYHKELNFEQKAKAALFTKQLIKIKTKLTEINKKDFSSQMAKFILTKWQILSTKQIITNDDLLISFQNFINEQSIRPNQGAQEIDYTDLQKLINKNLFLAAFFSLKKTNKQRLNQQQLLNIVRTDQELTKSLQDSPLQLLSSKTFTVPYQSNLYNIKPKTIQKQNQQNQVQSSSKPFHASSIPKTTYEKPKQRPKSHFSKTQAAPFHLTQSHTNHPKPEEYYKWDRNFHAKPIPVTTYKPKTLITSNQTEIKQKAVEILKDAQFPVTMAYLQDYRKYEQMKYQKLSRKYTKTKTNITVHPIPNFNRTHRDEIKQLEQTKQQNRKLTKPQPFNLSQPRQQKQYQLMRTLQVPQTTHKQIPKQLNQSTFQVKSTLKQEAYAEYRKKQKQQKQQQQQALNKQQTKLQKSKVQYTDILKNRIEDELSAHPKPKLYPASFSSNTVKLNLQQIYNEQPLLMQRQTAKSKKKVQEDHLNWRPII